MNSEIDVFVIPHTRMKELVKETSSQVFGTDFSDDCAVEGMLNSLNDAFHEFQHHEEIENKYILEKLKMRLTKSELLDLVGNIHHDTHVKDILMLIKRAFAHEYEDACQRSLFKKELQKAVKDFINNFLPHMEEEEEVFQPLLSTYFTRNELQHLREQIVFLHAFTLNNEQSTAAAVYGEDLTSSNTGLSTLPDELLLRVFTHLSPQDLCRCAQVCRQWSKVSWDGSLWKRLHPVRWIFRDDWRTGMDDYEPCSCDDGSCDNKDHWDGESISSGSASLESAEDCEEVDQRRWELETNQEENIHRLVLMARYLIPAIGSHVQVLVLACCPGLTNGLVYKMLSNCKNLEFLDLSQNNISDLGLNALFRKNGGRLLKHVDLSGCAKITDKSLKKLSVALVQLSDKTDRDSSDESDGYSRVVEMGSKNVGLKYLSLSGCYQITDSGVRTLARNGSLKQLTYLDLSGCLRLSAAGLRDLVAACPALRHESLFYCDNISEGPYPETAGGCQNLECTRRVCCRSELLCYKNQ